MAAHRGRARRAAARSGAGKGAHPVYNRQLRRPGQLCGFAFDGRRLRLARGEEIDAETLPYVYGLWRSRRAAMQALRNAADEHRLCLQTLGFDVKRLGACLRHQMGRCAGVCAGGKPARAPRTRGDGARRPEERGMAASRPARGDRARPPARCHRGSCARPVVLPRHRELRQRSRRAAGGRAARGSTTTTTASSRATSASAACAWCRSPPDALRAAHRRLVFRQCRWPVRRARAASRAGPAAAPRRTHPGAVAAGRVRARRRTFPAGALTLLASGGDPGESSWTRADPAHLRVMHDHVAACRARVRSAANRSGGMSQPSTPTSPMPAEFDAREPRHWLRDSSRCRPASPQRWTPPGETRARRGRRAADEAQMLLHAHPVNEAREARGELPVNSLWLWGAGARAARAPLPLAVGHRRRSGGARRRASPGSASSPAARLGAGVARPAARGRPPPRAARCAPGSARRLEQRWFAPLLAALRAGRVGMVTLHVPDGAPEVSFETIGATCAASGGGRSPSRATHEDRRTGLRRVATVARWSRQALHPVLARVYAGAPHPDGEASRVRGRLDGLITPQALKGAADAARLLADAIAAREPPADRRRLRRRRRHRVRGRRARAACVSGRHVDYLVPDRFKLGYGLSPELVDLAALRKPDLIITVDNGIASVEGVARAAALGIATLVTDHHLPGDTLPEAECIVNPNQPGCAFPSKALAGVGVMFYVMLALRAELRGRGFLQGREGTQPRRADRPRRVGHRRRRRPAGREQPDPRCAGPEAPACGTLAPRPRRARSRRRPRGGGRELLRPGLHPRAAPERRGAPRRHGPRHRVPDHRR